MSSVYRCRYGYCFEGAKAVDEIYKPPSGENELLSIAITNKEQNPWIQIDLGQAYCISAVKIWNRYIPTDERRLIRYRLYILIVMVEMLP